MKAEPYLFLNGRCEEAIAFYRSAVGAELVMLMRMKDSPDAHPTGMLPPGSEDKVMHATLRIGSTQVMLSDGMASGALEFKGFSLSLGVDDQAEAQELFAALSKGGQVQMPLGKTFFAPCFGMLTDRFGVSWMVISAT